MLNKELRMVKEWLSSGVEISDGKTGEDSRKRGGRRGFTFHQKIYK